MIYLLYGPDSYRSREKLNEIIEAYRAKARGVLDIDRFDAEEGDAALLSKFGQAHSLFQKKKLVIIERPSLGDEKFVKALRLAAKDWKDDANTIVVLWDDGAGKTKWLPAVDSLADSAHEYKKMTPAEAKKWLGVFLKKEKLELSPKTADELVIKFAADTWRLVNEAGKVGMGGDMAELLEVDDKKIFSFLDFLFLDKVRTLQALISLREAGVNEHYIFSAAVNHTRLLLVLADGHGLGSEAGTHPFVLQKVQRKARSLERQKLRALYERLFDEDVKIKTGVSDPYSSLVQLILNP